MCCIEKYEIDTVYLGDEVTAVAGIVHPVSKSELLLLAI